MLKENRDNAGRLAGLPDVLTLAEMAAALRVGVSTAYELMRVGAIKGKRIGRTWRILRTSVLQYLEEEADEECEDASSPAATRGS